MDASNGGIILVTGGAGYIGSHITLELLSEGYDVLVVDNFVNAAQDIKNGRPVCLQRIEELTGRRCQFENVDITDAQAVKKLFTNHNIYCIMHCAALKSVNKSCEIPLDYYKVNVAGTINLLEAAKNAGVRKIVYSGSCTVYGIPQYLPVDENHPTGVEITNPYGRTKHIGELILKDLHKSDDNWDIVILRYFNPVGCHESGCIGEDPQGTSINLMPYLAQVAVTRQEKLQIFGSDYETPDGTCRLCGRNLHERRKRPHSMLKTV